MANWTEADIPDQRGRRILITGANSGLGLCAAKALSKTGAHILLACRSPQRAESALAALDTPNAELIQLDLADLSSVRAAAKEVRERTEDKLDVLINNAGVMMTPKQQTSDGFELQFGTNHLGHAALTWLLMPALRATDNARVVTMSSFMAQLGHVDTNDPNFEHRRYTSTMSYGQSKMANLLFALELDKRLRAAGAPVISVAAHPGYSNTELQTNTARNTNSGLVQRFLPLATNIMAQPASKGALPELFAATARDVAGGDYIGPNGLFEVRGYPKKVPIRRAANQERTRERLWNLTAELTRIAPDPL